MKVIWETMRKDILVQNVYILDPEILLTMPCKQVDSHYSLVCENGIVIIAVSLAIIFQFLFIWITYMHINLYQFKLFLAGNHT